MEEDVKGRTIPLIQDIRNAHIILAGRLKERDHLGALGIDGKR
jgi:hypothetical protein